MILRSGDGLPGRVALASIVPRLLTLICCCVLAACAAREPTDLSAVTSSGAITYESADGIDWYADIFAGKAFQPRQLTSRLYLPAVCEGGSGRVPAVIIQHGSGAPRHTWYSQLANRLTQLGIAALVADSFSGRGITGTSRDQTKLSLANRVYDAFAAFRALQEIPCIDPDRIGITGYSFGGWVSREVVETALASRLGGGRVFKASVPVYPGGCRARWERSRPTNTRVHFLLAGLDDYTPAKDCLEHQLPYLREAGWDVHHTVYPDAHHAFTADRFYGRTDSMTFKDCGKTRITDSGTHVGEGADGSHPVNLSETSWSESIRTVASRCGRRGVTVGRSEPARSQAMEFTVRFFADNL